MLTSVHIRQTVHRKSLTGNVLSGNIYARNVSSVAVLETTSVDFLARSELVAAEDAFIPLWVALLAVHTA